MIHSGDSKQVPRLITWISKNPHLPPPHKDNFEHETYKKTVIRVLPGRSVKGTIHEDDEGNVTFDGEFVTPRSPDGKDASKLDDVEKENFKALLNNEKPAVDKKERERFPGLEETKKYLKKKRPPH